MKKTEITFETYPTIYEDESKDDIESSMVDLFTVDAIWALNWIEKKYNETLESYIKNYDYEKSNEMYKEANETNALISQKRIWRI